MRILTTLILLFFTGCANSPHINPTPQATADRSWVTSDAVIYGADPVHGFYKFALNQAQFETLANNAVSPQALYISPDKSEVYIDSLGPEMVELHLIYNTKTGVLHDLGPLIAPYSILPQISPDWHYIAWANFREPGVHIVDLYSKTVRTFHLPDAAEKGGLVMVGAWTKDGSVLVTRRPWEDRTSKWTYWKIDPLSGAATPIEARNVIGATTYLENGQPIGFECSLCDGTHSVNQITTPSGATAYISVDHDLVVKDSDGSLNIVAKHIAPPPTPTGGAVCMCGTEGKYPKLWTIFDGDVLLYSFGNFDAGEELFVYGIAEHKISQLGVAPLKLVF